MHDKSGFGGVDRDFKGDLMEFNGIYKGILWDSIGICGNLMGPNLDLVGLQWDLNEASVGI